MTSGVDVAAKSPGFQVQGRFLYDRCGEKVILRGVNKMTVWTDINGKHLPEIAKSGANVCRMVWTSDSWAKSSQMDAAIKKCIDNKMIPMIENHSATGDWGKLKGVVNWWCRKENVDVIKKHEKYLLVNIANECGRTVSESQFKSGYGSAIKQMRNAGIRTTLVIDGSEWGKDINILQKCGPYLTGVDPEKNILFSVHMWWPTKWGYSANQVRKELQESVNMNLPLIVGEFAHAAVGCVGDVPYKTILDECHKHQIGWMAWSWGPGNGDCKAMDMTSNGSYSTLRGWGKEVAVTHAYSIKNTATRPRSIATGSCGKVGAVRIIPRPVEAAGTAACIPAVPDGLFGLDGRYAPVRKDGGIGTGVEHGCVRINPQEGVTIISPVPHP